MRARLRKDYRPKYARPIAVKEGEQVVLGQRSVMDALRIAERATQDRQ